MTQYKISLEDKTHPRGYAIINGPYIFCQRLSKKDAQTVLTALKFQTEYESDINALLGSVERVKDTIEKENLPLVAATYCGNLIAGWKSILAKRKAA